MSIARMKSDIQASQSTLDEIKTEMRALYAETKAGTMDLKMAGELANITGKFLKAEQLKLAWQLFLENKQPHLKQITIEDLRESNNG